MTSKFKLVKTGGIYLYNGESNIVVKLNGKVEKSAGMFEKNLLIDDLIPATYNVIVEKEGYRVWEKKIEVQEQIVEVCYPLLIPSEIKPQLVPKYLLVKPASKTRKAVYAANEEYSETIELFRTHDKSVKSVIPGWGDGDIKKYKLDANRRLRKKVFLARAGNCIYVKWTGRDESRPFFIDTKGAKLAYAPNKKILSFVFFPGRNDSMLVLLEDGTLYAVEIDTRFDVHNIYKLARNCRTFAVADELLYYFSGNTMYKIDFEP